MKKLWINRIYLAGNTSKIISGIYAFLGFISLFTSFEGVFPETLSFFNKIVYSTIILVTSWVLMFIFVSLYYLKIKRVEVFEGNNGNKLYLQYGDIFDKREIFDENQRRNIVIPVNRCFDAIVDNKLISEKTLHGIALKKLYKSGVYTEESLTEVLQKSLSNVCFELLSTEQKPKGNKRRYPAGTAIDLEVDDATHYLLWALSTFDSNLKAHTSMQDFALATQRLIEACNLESEGFPVVIPLVGTGLSRTNRTQNDVLKYLITSFELNKELLNCDIHIVVREDLKNQIPIWGIK